MTWYDSRARALAVGQRVAYNRSGNVVEGEIVHLTHSAVHIMPHPDYRRSYAASPLSKVKRGHSIMVLPPKKDEPKYEEFDLPCPHHVPCANACQGTAYRRVRA